jgi:beta-glucosidase
VPGLPDLDAGPGERRGHLTIELSGSGSSLGILAAANNGTATGTVTVTYTDGTTSSTQVSVADWYANQAVPGSDILVTTPDWNQPPAAAVTPSPA